MLVKVDLKKTSYNKDLLKKLQKTLESASVYVGIPQDKNARVEGEVTNASLLYLHSKGSPLAHLPARPVIEPALEDTENKLRLVELLTKATKEALRGDEEGFKRGLQVTGMFAQNICRGWFVNPKNNWAPLSPITIAKKGSDKPLIDTGQLRKAITYVVK